MKADLDLAFLAVGQNWEVLAHVPDSLRTNRKLMAEGARQDWRALAYLPKRLKNSPEGLRGDRELIKLGIEQSGLALQHASEELRSEPKFVIDAMKQDWQAVQFAVGPFDADHKFWKEVTANFPELPARFLPGYEPPADEVELAAAAAA